MATIWIHRSTASAEPADRRSPRYSRRRQIWFRVRWWKNTSKPSGAAAGSSSDNERSRRLDLPPRRRVEPRLEKQAGQRVDVVSESLTPQERRFEQARAPPHERVEHHVAGGPSGA